MRTSNTVLFCAIDDLIPVSNRPLTGFPEFLDSLADQGIPCVWLSSRNRHQLDATIRRMGHGAPFIAEGGCAAYIAEDYFHLKPVHTIRLGRFIVIPVAQPQPAAAEALERVAEETGVEVVPLASLKPRELLQNTGLPKSEVASIRQRDFDELFFFAGASNEDIQRFQQHAVNLKYSVRPHGSLWSLAVGARVKTCVRELRKLYDRALHKPVFSVGLATTGDAAELFPACDRTILLTERTGGENLRRLDSGTAPKLLPLFAAGTWTEALGAIQTRSF